MSRYAFSLALVLLASSAQGYTVPYRFTWDEMHLQVIWKDPSLPCDRACQFRLTNSITEDDVPWLFDLFGHADTEALTWNIDVIFYSPTTGSIGATSGLFDLGEYEVDPPGFDPPYTAAAVPGAHFDWRWEWGSGLELIDPRVIPLDPVTLIGDANFLINYGQLIGTPHGGVSDGIEIVMEETTPRVLMNLRIDCSAGAYGCVANLIGAGPDVEFDPNWYGGASPHTYRFAVKADPEGREYIYDEPSAAYSAAYSSVPEPSAAWLVVLGLGLAGLARVRPCAS